MAGDGSHISVKRREIPGPLKGVRILDLSGFLSASSCTSLLGAMGAEVIKIESIQRPDGFRLSHTSDHDPVYETGAMWNAANLNKLDLTLNLADAEGVDVFLRLLTISDVVVENFSARVMPNLGLTYERLRAVDPRIIMVSVPGFGLSGPWEHHVGFANTFEQLSGASHLTRYSNGPPENLAGICDLVVGQHVAFAILAALHRRRETGEGIFVEVSQLEAFTEVLGDQIANCSISGEERTHNGNTHPVYAPHSVFRCRGDDRWVAISVRDSREWARLRRALGDPEWARDRRFSTMKGRKAHEEELTQHMEEWTSRRTAEEAMVLLQRAGVPAGRVADTADLLNDPQLLAQGLHTWIDRPVVGRHAYPEWSIRLSKTPGRHRSPAPTLGQHNGRVLCELLGLPPGRLAELAERKVIGTRALGA